MFAVVVTFQIAPQQMAAFMPRMLENARISLESEAGCHQFDVASDEARPNEVFLYELYTNKAAFDVHLGSAHFHTFSAQTEQMIVDKSVLTYAKVQQ